MIPSAFDYQAPTSVDDALAALSAAGDEGKVLAGGQSLLPVMRLRLAAPEMIIDLGRIAELQGVSDDGDAIVIGAMTPHHVVASDPLVAEHGALIAKATQTIADPQVRHRGTFGGALAHADPAGDLLAPALALDAEFEIAGSGGRRTVPASEFFVDLFTTAIGEDEILTSVRVPKTTGWKSDYQKFTRVAQQWSIVGVAAAIRVEGDSIAEARIALTNMGSTPIRASAVEQALSGCALDETAIAAATASAGEGTNPPSDTNGDAAFRRHLAGVLTGRAVSTAAGVVSSSAGAA
ncbi:FAD binding domain-containing protein [Aeromicrobium sp.]|uniref:FAD binding domain-containing protein n=1 Tax=Aeromicrobium sp. TaxID=1871063 RepID=UPI003D6BB31C